MNDLLYVIPANSKKEDIIATLKQHPEIKFVSLVGIDLAGNDTDEKIPMRVFLEDIDSFYNGSAVQTDGSSVVLTGIATLNNAKVDMPIDPTVNWFVDYNIESYDDELGKPVGTLRIPAALIHDGKAVDSRSILANTLTYVKKGLLDLFKNNAKISGLEHINGADVKDIVFTSATELEFWVKTPLSEADIPEMSASQVMQEQYWQRTRGAVRTALEQCMLALEAYGLSPEMGHKEVGGMKGHMDTDGNMTHVCEQVEIDWKFADALQAADNELVVRILVKEIFRENGLEVNFKAKPMIGLAGNGEHTHFGIGAIMNDGSFVNLFAPTDMKKDFMSAVGFELRACNPYTNTYLVLAAIYTSILDGVKYAVTKTTAELLAEISKDVGDDAGYLEKDRAYRAEDDVFEDYTEEERHQRFGVHPATVWENFSNLKKYPEKRAVLTEGKAFSDKIIDAFVEGELIRWKTELISRIIPENRMLISKFKEIKSAYVTDEDSYNWNKLNRIRYYLAKDSIDNKSLFTQLINALNSGDFATASSLQVEMYDKMEELKELYATYRNNMI